MTTTSKQMRRPSDSLLTLIFARTLSTRITPLVAQTTITPLQVTLGGLFLGMLAACLASQGGWGYQIGAALFLEMSHVLDCVDGELARLTSRGSPFAAAMDPITDRLKDIAILLAAFVYSAMTPPFDLGVEALATIAILATGLWLFYMYIVDAHLNPSIKKRRSTSPKVYLGLYDLFVYGSIFFLLLGLFEFFLLYILIIVPWAIVIQIKRLKNFLL